MTDTGDHGPAGQVAGWDVRRYGTVTSTMDVSAELLAAGPPAGPTVVVADHQTAGRGRADRAWHSRPGTALQMTAILRFPVSPIDLGPVPLMVGGAVADALEAMDGDLDLALKWPNDVLVGDRKVAGILVVSRAIGDESVVQVGIGINVLDPEDPEGRGTGLAHLVDGSDVDAVRERLMSLILERLRRLPEAVTTEADVQHRLRRWTDRAILLGQEVTVVDGDRSRSGVLLGVDHRGALRLREASGEVVTVVAGDLTRGPRPFDDIPAEA